MSIGDREVYPSELKNAHLRGLTYREWLIGMLASNPATLMEMTNKGFEHSNPDANAEYIMLQANAIIGLLDKEVK